VGNKLQLCICKDNTTVGGITLYVEDKGGSSFCIWTYTCAEREILYNTYQEMAIWKSIVTLIYRELLALCRKIDIFKLIYRYLLAFGR
jgi:hypothetical protein